MVRKRPFGLKEITDIIETTYGSNHRKNYGQTGSFQDDLDFLNSSWDMGLFQPVFTSHRGKVMGYLITRTKNILYRFIKRILFPLIDHFTKIFSAFVRVAINQGIIISTLKDRLDSLEVVTEQNSKDIKDLREELINYIADMKAQSVLLNKITQQRLGLDIHECFDWFDFEQKFYGHQELVKAKLQKYVGYFNPQQPVLDVGCGRGEFLELLGAQGIPAIGVDKEEKNIRMCNEKGLHIVHSNVFEYLNKVPDNSLGGIFSAQVVEHFETDELIEFLKLSYEKVGVGGVLIIETVNIQSLVALTNFYLDITHKRPIHPRTLQYLVESVGFSEVSISYTMPFPDDLLLSYIETAEYNTLDGNAKVINDNIKKLNTLLYGYHDYAIIAKKCRGRTQ